MAISETIRLIVEAVTGDATTGIQGFGATVQNELSKAATWLEEKIPGSSAFAGAALGSFAVSAAGNIADVGRKIVQFGVDSVGAFQDLAIAAGKMSTATGLSVEDASRWIEVTDDLGVNTDTVTAAMNRMNREAEKGTLAQLGIDATNTNDRFLESIQYLAGITDETERAAVAQQIFGRSWQELSPLIDHVAELRDRMADVSDQKLITDEEFRNAERFRDQVDTISDAADNVKLAFGEFAADFLSRTATMSESVSGLIGKLADSGPEVGGKGLLGWMKDLGAEANPLSIGMDLFRSATDGLRDSADKANTSYGGFTGAISNLGSMLNTVSSTASDALKLQNDQLKEAVENYNNLQQAQRNQMDATIAAISSQFAYEDSLADVHDALQNLWDVQQDPNATTEELAAAMRGVRQPILDVGDAAVKMAEDQAKANGQMLSADNAKTIFLTAINQVKAEMPALGTVVDGIAASLGGFNQQMETALNWPSFNGPGAIIEDPSGGGSNALSGFTFINNGTVLGITDFIDQANDAMGQMASGMYAGPLYGPQ